MEPASAGGTLNEAASREAEPHRGYVVSWRLAGRRVVVVGGGPAAEAKVTGLLGTGAEIVVVAPEVEARLEELAAAGAVTWVARRVRRRHLRRAALVVVATGTERTNAWVCRHAHRAGALVNAVDDPRRCDVTVPAVVRRGPATVAVTTDGQSPAAARFLREHLSAALPAEMGEMVAQAASARARLRRQGRYRYDYYAWKQRFFEPAVEAIAAGRGPGVLEELARRLVAGFDAPSPLRPGGISLVAGAGDDRPLGERATEVLAEADVVVYEPGVPATLLDLAPVGALRLPASAGSGAGGDAAQVGRMLRDHAGTGAAVVHLATGPAPALDVDVSGLRVELVPPATEPAGAPAR
ncbi:MAG TPA: NAD(P)-dependent oxidoreductase [Acidimicrobiales bacterium]|nr:NAD(P)-dependent oxidoreductase [Acidimicrobiales bacterium]